MIGNGNDIATDITADARALQERDEFRAQGWLKIMAPAKVNLHLAIGARRPDGYHEAATVMQAMNLHDVVYMRRAVPGAENARKPVVRMVSCGDVVAPELDSRDNIAAKAIEALADCVGRADRGVEVRIEKNIPAEGGLGGGSSDAAAALVGAARLWGLAPDDAAIERAARGLGSDVAFFLHGGCSYYEGTGEVFVHALQPSKRAVALVKPAGGVSTGQAYRTFDEAPAAVPAEAAQLAASAERADDVALFNNLASASEVLRPELGDIRRWLAGQPGVQGALLCGSGATTFAVCDGFAAASAIVAEARKKGYWARATSFGSARAMIVAE
ncbi:MAG TPA: 4-(cytidine 5'-diphospho)-2-C-methyl-D-erythritol kinase [Eggerthellaceae bacterium]|nr:4-(cytidine 5'-diphospho)-2-C-methyl-D-erythritol kinase [Eggerthellaceae bacterium]